jgi:hypothetical protein
VKRRRGKPSAALAAQSESFAAHLHKRHAFTLTRSQAVRGAAPPCPCANLPRNNQIKDWLGAREYNSSLVAVRLAWSKFAISAHMFFQ